MRTRPTSEHRRARRSFVQESGPALSPPAVRGTPAPSPRPPISADEQFDRAHLLERAGREAAKDGGARRCPPSSSEQAIDLLEQLGDRHAAARVAVRTCRGFCASGDRIDEALANSCRTAYDALAGGEPNADVALVAAQPARIAYFAGDPTHASELVEVALDMVGVAPAAGGACRGADHQRNAAVATARTNPERSSRKRSGSPAPTTFTPPAFARSSTFPAWQSSTTASTRLTRSLEEALALARMRGDRTWETNILGQAAEVLVLQGKWNEATSVLESAIENEAHGFGTALLLLPQVSLLVNRGAIDDAQALMTRNAALRDSSDRQTEATYLLSEAQLLRAQGNPEDALVAARESIDVWRVLHQPHYSAEAYVEAVEAALALGDLERAAAFLRELDTLPSIERRPILEAHMPRLRAKVEAGGSDELSATAAKTFAESG